MAINVEVNGVNRNAFARYKTCRVQKDGPVETCRVEFLDRNLTAAAFRVEPGDEIHIDRDGTALEFGGTVERVTDSRLTGLDNPLAPSSGLEGGATVTTVEARGWYFEAADVKIPIPRREGRISRCWSITTTLSRRSSTTSRSRAAIPGA
jgi:hypothetical protein